MRAVQEKEEGLKRKNAEEKAMMASKAEEQRLRGLLASGVCVRACAFVCVPVRLFGPVCIYTYMCVCIYTRIHTHIHSQMASMAVEQRLRGLIASGVCVRARDVYMYEHLCASLFVCTQTHARAHTQKFCVARARTHTKVLCARVRLCAFLFVCTPTHARAHTQKSVCVHLFLILCVYIYMCVCVYIHAHTHTHTMMAFKTAEQRHHGLLASGVCARVRV